jgi:hypothetical protein
MRSAGKVEPASQQDIMLIADLEQVHEDENILTLLYPGTAFPYCPPWKPNRTSEVPGTITWTSTYVDSIDSIAKQVKEEFSAIPGVEQVYGRRDSDFYRVWTVVPEMNRDLEDQICAAELASMDSFPHIRFDFTVIFRQGKDPASIRPSGAFLIHG